MRASISAVGLWAGASALLFGSLVAPAGAVPINNGCGYTRSDSDLNGDGFDDAVVGDPYATVDGKREAGAIVVLFGDADGRIGEGKRRILTQASVPGSYVEAGDHFGWSVAIDDATMDLCADLLVGSPGEDWQGHKDAGIAHLISFAPDLEGGPGVPIPAAQRGDPRPRRGGRRRVRHQRRDRRRPGCRRGSGRDRGAG